MEAVGNFNEALAKRPNDPDLLYYSRPLRRTSFKGRHRHLDCGFTLIRRARIRRLAEKLFRSCGKCLQAEKRVPGGLASAAGTARPSSRTRPGLRQLRPVLKAEDEFSRGGQTARQCRGWRIVSDRHYSKKESSTRRVRNSNEPMP